MKLLAPTILAIVLAAPVHAASPDDFVVDAVMDGSVLRVSFESPYPIGDDGRRPMLQLDLPEGVAPVEEPIDDPQGARQFVNAFAGFPWGRVVDEPSVEVPLVVDDPAGEIGINVTTYLDGERAGDAVFVRRRLQIEARDGARARRVEPVRTDWGPGGLAHVGDRAPDFDLPAGDGDRVVLSDELEKGAPIFLLIYRSDW